MCSNNSLIKKMFLLLVLNLLLSVPATARDTGSIPRQNEPGPGDIVFKPMPNPLPPLTLNDLSCGSVPDDKQGPCNSTCEAQNLCTLMCVYRKTAEGVCTPRARCGDCSEIPPVMEPSDGTGGGGGMR
jgi:hypothetical protein